VHDLNAALPSYETIKKFTILENDFSIEGGELTPTVKAKRGFIQEKYRPVIDTMYVSESKATAEPPSARV
jgi:long-chain acyl-CoA synthetase